MAHALYNAWRYGHENPYCLYNMLDARHVPWGGGEPEPPLHPLRVQTFILACGQVAAEDAVKLAGGNVPRRRPSVKQQRATQRGQESR